MNILQVIGWFIAGKAGELVVAARNAVVQMLRLAVMSILLPSIIIMIGLWLGFRAELRAEALNAQAASVTITIGALLGCVATAFLWGRIAVPIYLTWLGTAIASRVSDKVPVLARTDADDTTQWARTVMAWTCNGFILILFLNRSDPLWKHLGQFAFLFACGLSLMLSAEWTKKKWGRVVATVFVIGNFGLTFLSYYSPAFAAHCDSANRYVFGNSEYSTLMTADRKKAMELNTKEMAKLLKDQDEIRQRGYALCGGNFCAGDLAKFRSNEARIATLQNDPYWEKRAAAVAPAPAPVAPVTASPPARRSLARASAPAPAKTNPYWSELDKYPDL